MAQTQLPKSLYPDAPLPNIEDEDRYAFFVKLRYKYSDNSDWQWYRFVTVYIDCGEKEGTYLKLVLPINNDFGIEEELEWAFNISRISRVQFHCYFFSTIDEIQWYLENHQNIEIVE